MTEIKVLDNSVTIRKKDKTARNEKGRNEKEVNYAIANITKDIISLILGKMCSQQFSSDGIYRVRINSFSNNSETFKS